jgi:hypothetical protein
VYFLVERHCRGFEIPWFRGLKILRAAYLQLQTLLSVWSYELIDQRGDEDVRGKIDRSVDSWEFE